MGDSNPHIIRINVSSRNTSQKTNIRRYADAYNDSSVARVKRTRVLELGAASETAISPAEVSSMALSMSRSRRVASRGIDLGTGLEGSPVQRLQSCAPRGDVVGLA